MYLYWYHLKEHRSTDVATEGYIGITNNLVDRHYAHSSGRTNAHLRNAFKKYGTSIIKTILFEGSENECQALEKTLRPTAKIGWNLAIGGGIPPSNLGKKHTTETKNKIGLGNKGKNLGRLSHFKGNSNRWDTKQKKMIGLVHKDKVITTKHREAISEKNRGTNHPRSTPITLVNILTPSIKYTFINMREASEILMLSYPSLRSQFRLRTKSFNKKGWKILFTD